MPIQYLRYLYNSLTFNLGYSLANFPSEVKDLIGRSLPWTLRLLTIATGISVLCGNGTRRS